MWLHLLSPYSADSRWQTAGTVLAVLAKTEGPSQWRLVKE
jgi:hypothetical protein